MSGFIVTFPSSRGVPCFLVTPARVGHPATRHYPWARTDFVAGVFPTQEAAQEALDQMVVIHHWIAPECNGGLSKRLEQAEILPASQVAGILLDPV